MTTTPPLNPARDPGPSSTAAHDPEQARLDAALHHAASDLAVSLQHEEQTRRRRRRLLIGASVMLVSSALVAAVVFSSGVLGAVPSTDPVPGSPPAVQQAATLGAEGWALWKAGDAAQGADRFRAALTADPAAPDLHNGLGWCLFAQRLLPDADAAFAACLELAPDHRAALNGRGQVAFAARDYPAAIAFFEQAPGAPAAQVGLAKAALLTGDFATAREAVARLKVAPGAGEPAMEAMLDKLQAAAEAGVLDDALRRQIEPAAPAANAQGNPEAEAVAQRGWQQWSGQRFREAEQTFREALELEPASTAALNGLGWSLLNQGRGAEGRPSFEACLEHEPHHAGALNGLAICQKNAGDLDAAVATWERGIALAPGQLNALTMGLSRAYAQRGNHAGVITLLDPHAAALTQHPDLAALLAEAKAANPAH